MVADSKPTILAVDDSILMQDLLKRTLAKDYRVLVVGSAIEALATLNHEPVSVLLLDVSMPGIDGLDLCRTIRAIPRFSNLPVVMLTAKDTLMDKVHGRMAGATEYLTKPFEAEKLLQVMERLVGATLLQEAKRMTECGADGVIPVITTEPQFQ